MFSAIEVGSHWYALAFFAVGLVMGIVLCFQILSAASKTHAFWISFFSKVESSWTLIDICEQLTAELRSRQEKHRKECAKCMAREDSNAEH